MFPHPTINDGLTTLSQGPNDSTSRVKIRFRPDQRRPKWCHRRERWWHPSSGIETALCSLTTIGKTTPSMEVYHDNSHEAAMEGHHAKTSWKTGERSPTSQCSCTQPSGSNGCHEQLRLWIGWSSDIFSWIGTTWLFSVFKHEKTFGCECVSGQYLPLRACLKVTMRTSMQEESKRCKPEVNGPPQKLRRK